MKRTTIKYILFGAVLFLSACQSILDKDPIATLDAGSFFQTEADAIQAINAAYKPLTFSNENNNFYWAFGSLASDEAIVGGDGSRPGLIELDALTHTPRTEEFTVFGKGNIQALHKPIWSWIRLKRFRIVLLKTVLLGRLYTEGVASLLLGRSQ